MPFQNTHFSSSGSQTMDLIRVKTSPIRRTNITSLIKKFIYFSDQVKVYHDYYFINQYYFAERNQKFTLLIEASLNGKLNIVKSLVERYSVIVDLVGNVVHNNLLVNGVTALWCACANGNIEVVKILVAHEANVNFLARKETCLFLENDYKINVNNSTCLMVACYNNHIDIAEYLMNNGADLNMQTSCESTAMHFVTQGNNFNMAKLIISHGPKLLKNNTSLTPAMVPAEQANKRMLQYIITVLDLSFEEEIEAEELLGASILTGRAFYHFDDGFNILHNTLLKRVHNPRLKKKVIKTLECYNHKVECQNVKELLAIKDSPDDIYFEALMIRERILGENNPLLMGSIIYRGGILRKAQNFKACLNLWIHALDIAIYNIMDISNDLKRFIKVFCIMIKCNAVFKLSYLKYILLSVSEYLIMLKGHISSNIFYLRKQHLENIYYSIIMSTLCFIRITSHVLSENCHEEDPEAVDELMKIIVEINKHDFRTKKGQTLLHLSLDHDTKIGIMFPTSSFWFPNLTAMKLLVYCGADVDAVDTVNNTPLHYISKIIIDFPQIQHAVDDTINTTSMAMELIKAGAHTDFVNKLGVCPHTGYLSNVLYLTNTKLRSLKCLSASVVNCHISKEYYYNKLPISLVKFANSH